MRERTAHTASPRFPEQRQAIQGKSGTKRHPKGERDVQPVKIPVPARQAEARPGSDTAARRRNTGLKGSRREPIPDSTETPRGIGQRR